MKLEEWLEFKQMPIHVFARKIGKTRSLVHKYMYEDVIPKHDTLVKIYLETSGLVSADDFHGLSDQLFKRNSQKNNLYKDKLHANSFR